MLFVDQALGFSFILPKGCLANIKSEPVMLIKTCSQRKLALAQWKLYYFNIVEYNDLLKVSVKNNEKKNIFNCHLPLLFVSKHNDPFCLLTVHIAHQVDIVFPLC